MNGKRMVIRDKRLFLQDIFDNLIKRLKVKQLSQKPESKAIKDDHKYKGDTDNFPSWTTTNLVNLRILSLINRMVLGSGAKFTIIDTLQFHNPPIQPLNYASNLLEKLASIEGMEYMPLYKTFNKAKSEGQSLIWKYDAHLNELGNEIFANSLFDFIEKSSE